MAKKERHIYLSPSIGCEVRVFTKDKGKYVKEKGRKVKRWGQVIIPEANECRESLSGNLRHSLQEAAGRCLPAKLVLTPPGIKTTSKESTVPIGHLTYNFTAPDTYKNLPEGLTDNNYIPLSHPLYRGLTKLFVTKNDQRNLFKVMDVFIGPIAILMGGTKAYRSSNLSRRIKTTLMHEVVPCSGKTCCCGGGGELDIRCLEGTIKYQGVSNFWLAHPAIFSIVLGMGRAAIECFCESGYKGLDKALDISTARLFLARLRLRKNLNQKNSQRLLGIIETVKSFLPKVKVRANPGAYPINEYTWTMFKRFIGQKLPEDFMKTWENHTNIYGSSAGFYRWCTGQSKLSKKFLSRPKNWSGTSGVMLHGISPYFG